MSLPLQIKRLLIQRVMSRKPGPRKSGGRGGGARDGTQSVGKLGPLTALPRVRFSTTDDFKRLACSFLNGFGRNFVCRLL